MKNIREILLIVFFFAHLIIDAENIVTVEQLLNKDETLNTSVGYHLTSELPFINSTVNLTNEDAWLFFDNLRPSEIITGYSSNIKINFDNAVSSFKLKRGYMATFAGNNDETGYSCVFIAEDADLEIPTMPLELKNKVSFIRVFRW
jgi:hypothetical protein